MNQNDLAFHDSIKPRWTTNHVLSYGATGNAPVVSGQMVSAKYPIVSQGKDVRFAKFKGEDVSTLPASDMFTSC